jgi:hypothetical protein
MLLGIDPGGDGKAIIAIGNPDTSTHTAVWVPGLGTDSSSTRDNVERMIWLNDAAQQHLDPGESVAMVYWLGYDAPEVSNASVVGEDRSKAGSEPYVNYMQGLRTAHEGSEHHLTAVGLLWLHRGRRGRAQCQHRMACVRCDFYTPKTSSSAQLLEATTGLQRMLVACRSPTTNAPRSTTTKPPSTASCNASPMSPAVRVKILRRVG